MKKFSITIIGNSVALRVRPTKNYPDNLNYSQLLQKKIETKLLDSIVCINNLSNGASTINEFYVKIDELIRTFPDFYIVNIGVVDASTREIPLWFYRIANSKRRNLLTTLSDAVYRNFIIKHRSLFVNLRFKRSWISKSVYKKYFDSLIHSLVKETNSQIIILPINIGNERIERELPGSQENHIAYNKVMEEIAQKYNQSFVDLSDLQSEQHYPDGVHYSTEGHEIVADRIAKIIIDKINNSKS